jgi:hypothetical protein
MIIGIVGFIGSGKGTVSDILVDQYGFQKESFAAGVKDAVSSIFDWPRHMLEGDTKESRDWREQPDAWWSEKLRHDLTPRYALQLMGTEAGRDVFHPDLWILSLMKRLDSTVDYVISDVRFPNEIQRIKEMGGYIVRVRRGNDPEWFGSSSDKMQQKYPEIHQSEWAWTSCVDYVDFCIENNYTLEVLKDDVFEMYQSLSYFHDNGNIYETQSRNA